jgi:hypothetical protein
VYQAYDPSCGGKGASEELSTPATGESALFVKTHGERLPVSKLGLKLGPKTLHTGAAEGAALGVDDEGASDTEIDAELAVDIILVTDWGPLLDVLLIELLVAVMLDDGMSTDEDRAIDVGRDSLAETELVDEAIVLVWLLTEGEGDSVAVEIAKLETAELSSELVVERAISLDDAIVDATELETSGVELAELLTKADDEWLLLGSAVDEGTAVAEVIETLLLETMGDETPADWLALAELMEELWVTELEAEGIATDDPAIDELGIGTLGTDELEAGELTGG